MLFFLVCFVLLSFAFVLYYCCLDACLLSNERQKGFDLDGKGAREDLREVGEGL